MDSELPSSPERCKELIDLANNLSNVDICFLLNLFASFPSAFFISLLYDFRPCTKADINRINIKILKRPMFYLKLLFQGKLKIC